ncbi:MAG: serine/threonine-protein kinase [Pirellulaceae bacterium]|nr:serine/threonine-protein kinase [Pirellulaceae bacterium]MDG2105015.1 serine/threonine-protein kinase [Pirellulaceae bacterium]
MNIPDGKSDVTADTLEVLVEEFTQQIRNGKTPNIADYQARLPECRDEIHELLSSVAMIEGLKDHPLSSSSSHRSPLEEIMGLERLGEYRIVRELGRGGMGIVLEAVHESLGRRVAIKVLPNRLVTEDKNVERFTREARAAAALHHTNIVSVFGLGHSDGYYYYVMEFIDGCSLDVVMASMRARSHQPSDASTLLAKTLLEEAGNGTPPKPTSEFDVTAASNSRSPIDVSEIPTGLARFQWAAGLIANIGDALEYAHKQGVLHRDIKPGNLLLDPAGRVWLTDFGLVKDLSNQTMTRAGDIVGTPQYMAPESFESKYNIASETYCLGATLHELVTLKPIIEPSSAAKMIRQATSSVRTKPRKLDPRIPADLATIIEKATDPTPSERYQTAGQMRDDLQCFLQDRPISAKPPAWPKRLWMWSKRNHWQAVSAALIGLVAILATAGFLSRSQSLKIMRAQNEQLTIERDNTEAARLQAETNAKKFKQQYARAEINIGLSLEVFDEMFKQMVLRGSGNTADFSFDGFQELSVIETRISPDDAQYLENMLVFLRKFANENTENTQLAAESANSWRRVANIYHLLGKPEDANEAYQTSLDQYNKFNQSNAQIETIIAEAQTTNEMGLLALSQKRSRQSVNLLKAMSNFEKAQEILRSNAYADQLPVQLEMVKTLNLMGSSIPIASTDTGNLKSTAERSSTSSNRRRGFLFRSVRKMGTDNLSYINQAIELISELIEQHGVTDELLLEKAKCELRLAKLQLWMNDRDQSQQAQEQAINSLSKINLELDATTPLQSATARFIKAQVWALPISRDTEQSIELLSDAAEITNQICEEFSSNSDYRLLDADVQYQLAQLKKSLASPTAMLEHYRKAHDSLREVYESSNRSPDIVFRFNELNVELGEVFIAQEMYRDAVRVLSGNARFLRSWGKRRSGNRSVPADLLKLLERQRELLVQSYEALGDPRSAQQVRSFGREGRGHGPPDRPPGKRREKQPKRGR